MLTQSIIKLALLLAFSLAGLNVSARALGTTQPPNPSLVGFTDGCEGKPQPCWYGIVPETSLRRDITRLVTAQKYVLGKEVFDGNLRVYSSYLPSSPVQSCQLSAIFGLRNDVVDYSLANCQGIRLGDIIELFGMNTRIGFAPGGLSTLAFSNATYKVVFSFAGDVSPLSPIKGMEIYPLIVPLPPVFVWHGFAPKARYCQFESDNAACS